MVDIDLVRALEQRCFNAWPTLRTLHVDGWVLRLADGHTRRANSASALYPSSLTAEALSGLVKDQFNKAGLQPTIRITPLAAEIIAAGLAKLGWREDDASLGLYAPEFHALLPQNVVVEPVASEQWLTGAMSAYGYGAAGVSALRRTLAHLILPAGFITLSQDGAPAAWALAVYERSMIGIYDLVIAPQFRQQGLGRKLSSACLAWGKAQGATSAYLQVRVGNAAARALYGSLGFETAYGYTHYVWG